MTVQIAGDGFGVTGASLSSVITASLPDPGQLPGTGERRSGAGDGA